MQSHHLVLLLSQLALDLALAGPIVTAGTIFSYMMQLSSFQRSNFGIYTCTTTIRPQPTVVFLRGIDMLSDTLNIKHSMMTLFDFFTNIVNK